MPAERSEGRAKRGGSFGDPTKRASLDDDYPWDYYTDDLVFVTGMYGFWESGARIHRDEVSIAIKSWADLCVFNIVNGVKKNSRGKDVIPVVSVTVEVVKNNSNWGFCARFIPADEVDVFSCLLLPCRSDNERLGY